MRERLAGDEIVLKIPASAAYSRILRVAIASAALRQGMSFAEIDELRGATDEAAALLLEHPVATDTEIECVLRPQQGCLEVQVSRTDNVGVGHGAAARFKRTVKASNVAATVETERGRLLLRKDIARPGSQPAA